MMICKSACLAASDLAADIITGFQSLPIEAFGIRLGNPDCFLAALSAKLVYQLCQIQLNHRGVADRDLAVVIDIR